MRAIIKKNKPIIFMTVYVVSGNEIKVGQFKALENDTVFFMTENGLQTEHSRNMYFKRKNAQYHLVRSLGIFRPILNGTS